MKIDLELPPDKVTIQKIESGSCFWYDDELYMILVDNQDLIKTDL